MKEKKHAAKVAARNEISETKKSSAPIKDEKSALFPISMINVDKNIRSDVGDLSSLKESIRLHGLLQPIVITKQNGKFTLVAGARRLQCLNELKQSHAPVRFVTTDEREAKTLRLVENLIREELNGIDEVNAVAELLPHFEGNQSALARAISKDQPYVNRCVRAAKILSEVGYATSHTPLTKSILFQMADAEDPKKSLEQIQSGEIKTVKEARQKSGAVAGGRFVEGAIQFRNASENGSFSLRVNFDPQRTPADTRGKIIETLKGLLQRLENM